MQPGLTLQDLAALVDERAKQKRDFIAPTRELTVSVDERENAGGQPDLLLNVPDQGAFPIQPVAERQLTSLTKIPAAYFERMRTADPELAAINANAWLRREPGTRMVRTLAGRNRAILSARYQRIDDMDVLKAALPVLHDLPDIKIVSSQITETKMYIQFVVPIPVGEVKVGDAIQVGGIISNSEVGHGRISVAGLIWRLWCLNGAVRGDTFARSHVGREIESNEQLWSEETQQLDDRLILSRIRDMVRAVVDETAARQSLGRLQELAGARITGKPDQAVKVLAQKTGITNAEGDAIFQSLIGGDNGGGVDLSAWGVINAVTAQAHAGDYDRAVDFERLGGKLIDLPANDWREILEAA